MLRIPRFKVNKAILNVTTVLVLYPLFFVSIDINQVLKGGETMILDILGYVFGLGFIVFGISALFFWGSEIYKIINKSKKKVSYKKSIYSAGIAVICALALIVMANAF